jgi:hypothetical protein
MGITILQSPSGISLVVDPDGAVHAVFGAPPGPTPPPIPTPAYLRDILVSSLRAIGVLQEGEMPSSPQIEGAMDAMNYMLDELSSSIFFALVSEDFPLVPGQAAYNIGIGGDFNTIRPIAIMDQCYVRDTYLANYVDYPVQLIGQAAYNSIDVKNVQSIPENFMYDPQYPLGIITFYYIPDKAYTFHCVSVKNLSEITALNTQISLPPEFKSFLKWNTAKVLASDYQGMTAAPNYLRVVLPMARRSMGMIQRINAANRVEEASMDIPMPQRGAQDWRGPFNAGRTY